MFTTTMLTPRTLITTNPSKTCESMAVKLIEALKNQSGDEFVALFPAKQQFLQVMKHNHEVYGGFLAEAEKEFEQYYDTRVMPRLFSNFEKLLDDGRKIGIEWSDIRLAEVEMIGLTNQSFGEAEVRVLIREGGKVHWLELSKSLVIEGSWYVSPSVALN